MQNEIRLQGDDWLFLYSDAVFEDDLTLILLRQTPEQLPVADRALSGARRLMMRWMKRHDTPCTTTLPTHNV